VRSDPERLKNLPEGMFGHSDKAKALEHGNLVVSCVGERTLFPEDYESLPDGAVLVNAASSNDELGPQDLQRFAKPGEMPCAMASAVGGVSKDFLFSLSPGETL